MKPSITHTPGASCRRTTIENLRELIIYPYRLIYRVKTDRIYVVAVFHGAQQLPDSFEG